LAVPARRHPLRGGAARRVHVRQQHPVGDCLLAVRSGHCLPTNVEAGSNRFAARADRVAVFSRVHVDAAGAATIDGRAWDGRLYALPVVDPAEAAPTRVPDRIEGSLQLPSRAVLTGLIDSGRLVDTTRLDAQFDAEQQEALLKHTAT
jgi:hypothetical protein